MKRLSRWSAHLINDMGSSMLETALVLPMLFLLLIGAVDFGRAFYLSMEVAGAAHAAAEYGIQVPYDTAGMLSAASSDAPNVPNLSVGSRSYGCECSDGTGYSANCATAPTCTNTTLVYRVNVTVSATYTPWFPWPGIPSNLSMSNSASMRSGGS